MNIESGIAASMKSPKINGKRDAKTNLALPLPHRIAAARYSEFIVYTLTRNRDLQPST
jgi:hypothetical protein